MGGESGGRASARDLRRYRDTARKELTEASGDGTRHLFISFATEDLDSVNLLRGQSANPENDLSFDDFSVQEAYDSKDADYIKRQIRARIERSSVTLVYVSPHSAKSKWVDWEIRESVRQGKGVVGVYQGSLTDSHVPSALREIGAQVVKWRHADMMAAIEKAAKTRT